MLKKKSNNYVRIVDTKDLKLIETVLQKLLYIPNKRLKSRIEKELVKYLSTKFTDKKYKIKVFVGYKNEIISGFVICQIDPGYKSRNRKCGTFGWLIANDFDVCESIMEFCESFIKENNTKILRGNINFPKAMGGMGIQIEGFNEEMLYGVAFSDPKSEILSYLERLGYKKDSEYICMEVSVKLWKKGKNLYNSFKFKHLSLEEIKNRKNEILGLAREAFSVLMPDSTTSEYRFNEFIDVYTQLPKSFYKLPDAFNPKKFLNIPEFLEDWEKNNLENAITWAHFAFDRKTDGIIGIILTVPDLYQLWLNKPITRANVDTALIKPSYSGKGIFSMLNNFGRLTSGFNGINYFEGTNIWNVNQDAIRTIMPHCKTNRKFVVVQKRIKKF